MAKQIEELKFNDWDSFLAYVKQPRPSHSGDRSNDPNFEFTRTNNYEEAMQLALLGWQDEAANARKLSNAILKQVGSLVEQDIEQFDVEGQGLDISVLNQGLPEHWVRYEQNYSKSPGSIVRIIFNQSVERRINASVMVNKGAAVAGLIECLELSGKQAEVWLAFYSTDWMDWNSVDYELRVCIKQAGQPLDMGRLMFAIAHPSSFRRLSFRALELSEHCYRRTLGGRGYGNVCEVPQDRDRGDLYIGCSDDPYAAVWNDEKLTRKWVIDQLRKQNIEVNDEAADLQPLDYQKHEFQPPEGLGFIPGGTEELEPEAEPESGSVEESEDEGDDELDMDADIPADDADEDGEDAYTSDDEDEEEALQQSEDDDVTPDESEDEDGEQTPDPADPTEPEDEDAEDVDTESTKGEESEDEGQGQKQSDEENAQQGIMETPQPTEEVFTTPRSWGFSEILRPVRLPRKRNKK